jgi:hypothetical protein
MFGMSRLPYDFAFVVLKTVSQKAMDVFEGVVKKLSCTCNLGRIEAPGTSD